MSLSLPQTLPGTPPLASIGQPQALLPAAPGTPALAMPAAAGFFMALQEAALPALWTPAVQEAGPGTTTPLLVPELPAGDGLAAPSDEDQPAAAVPAPQAPLFAPVAATPAFQPHGLALMNASASLATAATVDATATTAPVPTEPSAAASTIAAPGPAATATVQQALPSFAAAAQQATLPPSQAPVPAAAPLQAVAQQMQPPLQAPAQALTVPQSEAQAAPLEKVLAAHHAAAARESGAVAWNPAAADGLPAPLSTPATAPAPAAHTDGKQAATALAEALGERIDWQIRRGSERAQIRLDPPMQGQLEITVRRDGAGLQIHLSATHSDVVRQLHAISDSLRGDLSMRQTGDVTVTIAQHAPRDQDGRGRQAQDNTPDPGPGRALAEAENDQAPQAFALTHSPQRNP